MSDATSAAPSDAELEALWDEAALPRIVTKRVGVSFARAVLAKWSAPQPDMTVVIARAKQEAIEAYLSRFGDEPQPVARVPLTDEQIKDEASRHGFIGNTDQLIKFVRCIEHAHGIKGGQHGAE